MMTKRFFIFMLFALLLTGVKAQEAVFNKYASEEGVRVTHVTKPLLAALVKSRANSANQLDSLISKLNELHVLFCDNERFSKRIGKEAVRTLHKSGYKDIPSLSSNNGEDLVMQQDQGKFAVISRHDEIIVLINVKGDLTIDDLKHINSLSLY